MGVAQDGLVRRYCQASILLGRFWASFPLLPPKSTIISLQGAVIQREIRLLFASKLVRVGIPYLASL